MSQGRPGVAGPGSEAFVTYAQGKLKVFNSAKNFGFICPVYRAENSEGPPLNLPSDDGLWFFGNHSLPPKAQPGVTISFEVWENSEGKPQARGVQLSSEQPAGLEAPPSGALEHGGDGGRDRQLRGRHPHEPRVIYPSVYISDVPVEYTEDTLRELHRQLSLNPETIMGLKFLPFTEASLGGGGKECQDGRMAPITGSVILRYCNEEAANAACERLRGHPIRTSTGVTKYLGARHAAPAKWMMDRKVAAADDGEKKPMLNQGESLMQKIRGSVVRVSAAGYGVIKSQELGEVMWRQYELPTNLRSLQFADPQRFQQEVQSRSDYQRLKEMEGLEVEAELYRLPDGQLRASHVRPLTRVLAETTSSQVAEGGSPSRSRAAATLTPTKVPGISGFVVCVHPVPLQWSSSELRERFEWYGNLTEASIERRVYDDSLRSRPGCLQPALPAAVRAEGVWSLGVLRFSDAKCAEEVIQHEHGGTLEEGGSAVVVEKGHLPQALGWCEGIVMRYFPAYGIGFMRSAMVDGDVHFEAPAEVRSVGQDLHGERIDAMVEFGADGSAQAREVRLKSESPDGQSPKGKKDKKKHKSGGEPLPPPPPGGQASWGAIGGGGGWGMPGDPYYKTQPCLYHRQGMCRMGATCYFAHSPAELRAAPEAMMLSHFTRMMGGGQPAAGKDKKEKKEKKEKKNKSKKRDREELEEEQEQQQEDGGPAEQGDAAAPPPEEAVSRTREEGFPSRGRGRQANDRGAGPQPPRKRRVHLDDSDF